MVKRYGEERTADILKIAVTAWRYFLASTSYRADLCTGDPPISVDKTEVQVYPVRLKGVPSKSRLTLRVSSTSLTRPPRYPER